MRKKDELTEKQQKIIAAAAFVIFLLVMAIIGWFIGVPILRFAGEPEEFRQWVEKSGFWASAAYMGMVIVQIIVALIPGEALEIAGGYAFGALEGTILCLIAATVGSLIVFGLVRRYGMRLVQVFFSAEKLHSLRFLRASKRRDMLFLIIFMIPGTPKDLLCYFAGLTDIKYPVWLLICSLGRLPSIITSTVGGNALGTESYIFAIIVFAVTLVLSGAGLVVYNRMGAGGKKNDDDTEN